MKIGPPEQIGFLDQPWWVQMIGALAIVFVYFYGWWCSRDAQKWLESQESFRSGRLSNGLRPYDWTEEQEESAEKAVER